MKKLNKKLLIIKLEIVLEKIIKEAKKYSRRVDFQRNSSGAYARMRQIDKKEKGFKDKVCSHMKIKRN